MRACRTLILPVVVVLAALIAPAAAKAEPYPLVPPSATVSTGTTSSGGSITFRGTGFIPGESITVDVTYTSTAMANLVNQLSFAITGVPAPQVVVRTVTADGDGSFSAAVTLSQAGTAVLTARGLTSGVTATATVRVTGSSAALATTGTSSKILIFSIVGGLATIVMGVLLVWLAYSWRRRGTVRAS